MTMRLAILAGVLLVLSQAAASQEIPAPSRDPLPTSEKHRTLIREGIALHDSKDYDAAIAKYREVLAENPDDVGALYEMGISYFAKGDYKQSMEAGLRGAQYKSKNLPLFYTLIGNTLDQTNDHDKAIKVYKSGIKMVAGEVQLHYNLAVAYARINRLDDARKTFKDAIACDPNHPSSHLGLSQVYEKGGDKMPALLALCRFLVLEPNSQRSLAVLQRLAEMRQSGARDTGDNNITITLSPPDKGAVSREGDFGAVDLMLSMLAATRRLDKNKGKTDMQLTVGEFDSLFAVLGEVDAGKKKSGFAWNYYRPYFAEMKRRNYVEPFCYYIFQSGKGEGVSTWLNQNAERVEEFRAWSKGYQWPKL